MIKIVVTGSNGMVGTYLLKRYENDSEYKIVFTSKHPIKNFLSKNHTAEILDITIPEQIERIIDNYKPDFIINCAGISQADQCELNKKLCWQVNTEGVKNLLMYAKKNNSHFIQLSTDMVFDGKKGLYSEQDPTIPISYYGLSKLSSEKLISESGLNHTIVRTVLLYGLNENKTRTNLMLWVKESLENGKQINVVYDQFRTPTLIYDFIEGLDRIIAKNKMGIYHISGKENMSIFDFANRVAENFNLNKSLLNPVTTRSLNQPAERPLYGGFIIEKAERELGYHPHSVAEGLSLLKKEFQ